MSIRYRLAAVIAAIVVPLIVGAGIVLAVFLPGRFADTQARELDIAARSIASAMTYECGALGYHAQVVALDVANGQDPAVVLRGLQGTRAEVSYDVVRVNGGPPLTGGNLAGADPTKPPAARCSAAPGALASSAGQPVLVEQATVETTHGSIEVTSVERITPAWVVAAKAAAGIPRTHVTMRCPTGVVSVAATDDPAVVSRSVPAAEGHPCEITAGESTLAGQRYRTWALVGFLLSIALAVALSLWLANGLTSPIRAVSDAARRATAGDRSVRLGLDRRDEIGELGRDFDAMVTELDNRIRQAEHGRDALRDTSRRLGDVLQRTHDLDGMLTALCALAETTADAACASVWMAEGFALRLRTVHPIGTARPQTRRLAGEAAAASSAASGRTTVVLADASTDPATSLGGRLVALPLVSGEQLLGVLVAERPPGAAPFSADEIERLELAIGSAGVAVDNAMLHRAVQRQSVVDPLTGVGNMRSLTTTLGREVERSKRFGRPVAVMIVDVDRFRQLNDELGPSVGDGVLKALAAYLLGHVRSVDTVARYGGEEFAVVCPELGQDFAQRAAQRLVDSVREAILDVLGVQVRITVSVGIACYPAHGETAPELITAADAAMAQAKRLGRDRAATAEPA